MTTEFVFQCPLWSTQYLVAFSATFLPSHAINGDDDDDGRDDDDDDDDDDVCGEYGVDDDDWLIEHLYFRHCWQCTI